MSLKYYMLAGTLLAGSFAASSAFAQNNNTGQIVVQGVVPGTWELTVEDINAGYDFDLNDASGDLTARIGTIHVKTNDISAAGGTLYIESANAGRLINSETIPGIANEHQEYLLTMTKNTLVDSNSTEFTTAPTLPADHNLRIPFTVAFAGSATVEENTYDVTLKVEGTDRPVASGVYTDTITFTIMDDN